LHKQLTAAMFSTRLKLLDRDCWRTASKAWRVCPQLCYPMKTTLLVHPVITVIWS